MITTRRTLVLAFLVAASTALAGCTMYGYSRTGVGVGVTYAPPAPRSYYYGDYRPGYVFIDGRWAWGTSGWYWTDGYWQAERPGYVYIDGYWDTRGGQYYWVNGRWNRPRPGYVWSRGYYQGNRWVQGSWTPGRAGHEYVQGHYQRQGNNHVWVGGTWRPQGSRGGGGPVYQRDHRTNPPPARRPYERVPAHRGGR